MERGRLSRLAPARARRARGVQALVRDLNRAYRESLRSGSSTSSPPASAGSRPNDAANNVLAFARLGEGDTPPLVCVLNLSPVPRHDYRVGLPACGRWREVLNTDSAFYGGSGVGNLGGVEAEARSVARAAVLGRAHAAAARRGLARARVTSPPMEVWPGRPFPLGATWDGEGTNFSLFSEHAERVELCLFDGDATRRASSCRDAPLTSGTATSRASGRASATATASTAPTSRERATASTRQAADRPLREGDRGAGRTGSAANVLPYVPGAGEDADLELDDEDDAMPIPKCVVIDPTLRLGGRPAARHAVARHRHLRGARQGLHDAPPGHPRGPARHLRRPRLRAAIAHLRELGVTAVELLPVHHIADESFLARPRA